MEPVAVETLDDVLGPTTGAPSGQVDRRASKQAAALTSHVDPRVAEYLRRVDEDTDVDVAATLANPQAPRSLTMAMVAASVSGLVPNADGRIVFGTVTLSALMLRDIDVLSSFPHLQRVLLDNNRLETLAPLRSCRALTYVSASHNLLTESCFADLVPSATTLEQLDLSFNQLKTLRGIDRLKYLVRFAADNNSLTCLQRGELGTLRSLQHVSLASNKISEIHPGSLAACPIRTFNLNANELTSIAALLECTRTLSVLLVNDNSILHMGPIRQFARLSTFEAAGNNIYDIAEVYALAELPLLRCVALLGNPLHSAVLDGVAGDADDTGSDIVRPDDDGTDKPQPILQASSKGGAAAFLPTIEPLVAAPTRFIPAAKRVAALRTAANAPYQPLAPQDEDTLQLQLLDQERRYRLSVIWRVPQLVTIDGRPVTEKESAQAKNLEGGVDRSARMQSQLVHLGPTVAAHYPPVHSTAASLQAVGGPSTTSVAGGGGIAAAALRKLHVNA